MHTVSARNDRIEVIVLAVAGVAHALLFILDWVHAFSSFTSGDRSGMRLDAMNWILQAPDGQHLARAVDSAVGPGEYLMQAPLYALIGPGAVVAFQIGLALLALRCVFRIGMWLFGKADVAATATLIYAFLPQSLIFPHQFVTETTAASFCVYFVYALMKYLRMGKLSDAAIAGATLGVVILIRPSLGLILPAVGGLLLVFRFKLTKKRIVGLGVASMLSLLPMGVWVGVFTAQTGQVGYTSGVANLDWNLRSRVYLVQTRSGMAPAPEVAHFRSYPELYGDFGGISVSRFAELAWQTPAPFLRAALIDEAILFGRGNSTKVTVDYLQLNTRNDIKEWRDVFDRGGLGPLLSWALANRTTLIVFVLEAFASLLTLAASALALGYVMLAGINWWRSRAWLNDVQCDFACIASGLIATAAVSALLVDRAQAKLRHPVEAMIVFLCLSAFVAWRRSASVRAETAAGASLGVVSGT